MIQQESQPEAQQAQQVYFYSAPGKTIISGEHSVVYYKNALVMAIDLRTFCKISLYDKSTYLGNHNDFLTMENKQDSKPVLHITQVDFQNILSAIASSKSELDFSDLQKQFADVEEKSLIISYLFISVFQKICEVKLKNSDLINTFNDKISSKFIIKVEINSTLPISKGLGSSASFFTALSASITKMCMSVLQENHLEGEFQKFVNDLAFSFEKIYHGTPSGIDNHIATYGNMLIFNKNHTSQLKINQLPYRILLIDSQIEKSTKAAVGRVREIYDDESIGSIGKQSIEMIGQVTDSIIEVFNQSSTAVFDQSKFENLIRMNQSLLRLFDVSHHAIENIMSICMKYGIAAKITGAGQGGNCIAFVPNHINEAKERDFLEELRSRGYEVISANLSVDGVREEKQ